jgi:hypothetical protein
LDGAPADDGWLSEASGRMSAVKDWVAWHLAYKDPDSALSRRLECVTGHLVRAVDNAPAGQVSLVSLCAGQGHDVLGVLPGHPRRDDVQAVLVEFDPSNAAVARLGAEEAGLARVQVREVDAGDVANYADALPADVLLLCGIFGNITDAEIERVALAAPAMCAPGATVIWTRHRREPDLTPRLRSWFAESGFDEVAFDEFDTEILVGVGVNRLSRPTLAKLPDGQLFTFGTEAG